MEKIKEYLDNVFGELPKTDKIVSIKADLLSNMEEKYHELRNEGKSPKKASEIVISEFGNINEILHEFGIQHDFLEGLDEDALTEENVKGYLSSNKRYGIGVGIGACICIIGAALMVLWYQLVEDNLISITRSISDVVGIVVILSSVSVAVAIFITAGVKMEKYNYIRKGKFILPAHIKGEIELTINEFRPKYIFALVIGTLLCILSPILIITTQAINPEWIVYAVVLLLVTVAIAVYVLVYYSIIYEGYKKINK